MFNRLFARRNDLLASPVASVVRKPCVELLENRTLLHNPTILGVQADNRGEVFIQLDADSAEIDPAQFNKNSVQMYTAGPDGIVGNSDDVRVAASVRFTASNQKLLVRGPVTAQLGYRVKIVSSRITVSSGFALDGEFNGSFPSGNGVAGGNFEFQTKNDKSSTPTARLYTSTGAVTIRLRKDLAPKAVNNFLAYANSGRFDNVFFTRSENNPSPFVIQGGSLQISGAGTAASDVIAPARDAAVIDENDLAGALSNTIGTLAFAKSGPDTATNQFFINLANNSFLDSPARQDGGFTVFATVTSGLSAAQAINAKPVADLSSQIGTVAGSTNTGVTNAPVNDEALAEASLNPFRDLMNIRRAAVVVKVAAV